MSRAIGTLLALPVVGLMACGSPGNDAAASPDVTGAPAVVDGGGRDLDAYPQPYRTMNLPALPGATVTSTGRQTTSLRDGLAIRLTTSMSVAEARDYYRRELDGRGWTEQVGPGRAAEAVIDLPIARLSFVQGPLTYTATITADAGTTQVALNVVER